MDPFILQRRLYRATAICDWCFRPVCFCSDARPVSTVVHPRADERVLYAHRFLVMGSECFVPQSGKISPRYCGLTLTSLAGIIRLLYHPLLGRSQAGERTRFRALVLGYNPLPRRAADRPGESGLDIRVSALHFTVQHVSCNACY